MEIRAPDGALGARHAEQFAERLQDGCLSRGIWADYRREVTVDFDRMGFRPEGAKPRDDDGFDTHKPLPELADSVLEHFLQMTRRRIMNSMGYAKAGQDLVG